MIRSILVGENRHGASIASHTQRYWHLMHGKLMR